MARPTFRRFWVRTLPDGSAKPQFDPRTGQYCGYEKYAGPVAQIHFLPITPRLEQLIHAHKDQAEASGLPRLTFDIPPGVGSDMYRKATLMLFSRRICGFCEAEFDSSVDVCPRCMAKNQWYCGACDAVVEKPIIDHEAKQVRCPTCEGTLPRGLRQIQCLGDFCEEKLFTHYILAFGKERHIILDYKIKKKAWK
jgi:hypothetical protein